MSENKQVHTANQHIRAVLDACDVSGVEVVGIGLSVLFGDKNYETHMRYYLKGISPDTMYIYWPINTDAPVQSTYDKVIESIDHARKIDSQGGAS